MKKEYKCLGADFVCVCVIFSREEIDSMQS